jgi:predicted DsbA family dithiol-disulfide isomerase
MQPVVDGLEKQYEDKVEFRRLNVETDQEAIELANQMGVTAVPTFVFVNSNGIEAGTKIGGATAEELSAELDKLQ